MSSISEFVKALKAIDAPLLKIVNPGLSPQELHSVVETHHPHLAQFIDPVIEEWWSWQNWVSEEKISKLRETMPHLDGLGSAITPEGYALFPLERVMKMFAGPIDKPYIPTTTQPSFPLLGDDAGCYHVLKKSDAAGPWHVYYIDRDEPFTFRPIRTQRQSAEDNIDVGANPTLDEYLSALTAAIQENRITVTSRGGLGMPGYDTWENLCYPWEDQKKPENEKIP